MNSSFPARVLVILSLCFFLCECTGNQEPNYGDIRGTVEALFRKVQSLQVKRDVPYIPPTFWEKHKGMWESDVKFYFHGHEELYLMREAFAIYDDNMFATSWITSCLLEAYRYGNTTKPTEEMITAAVLSIREYHNKNVPYANSLMTFWPQVFNATYKTWDSYPINLHHFFDLAASANFTSFEKFLEKIGLEDVAEIMIRLLKSEHGYLHAFMIPPDFDDTFVNIGLGSLLIELKDDFPDSHAQWQSQNTNVTSVFDALKKYAYRPMSNDTGINTIDVRTYFYIRHFLEEAKQNGENISLVPTWIQNINEVKTMGPKGVDMPFNINNVDVTVAANAVYGTTAGVLNGIVDVEVLDDKEIQILDKVKSLLDEVLHDHMTSAVLNQTKTDADGNLYIDDFVGDGDLDANNNTVVRGQDRLFTTGMAINALLSTWTVFDDETRQLIWQKDTPQEIKDTVTKAASFVNKHIFGLQYQPWNAFFSGSVKGRTTYTEYPATRNQREPIYLRGMEGVITEAEYQAMMVKEHSPVDFHGYNSYPDYWPFWCSEPYTYVTTMLALSKFSNTVEPS